MGAEHYNSNEWCFKSRFCTILGYTGPGITWANGMNINMNPALGAGSIGGPVDQQSSALEMYHGRSLSLIATRAHDLKAV